tara:strand:+ start:57 stop:242 length:186 start_codon:yes stop_codon:yes gene_type:complete
MTPDNSKVDINKKMVGKTVLVVSEGNNWTGVVSDVLDEKTFKVTDIKGENKSVDIFDIRSV